ncbi:MAG TPA: NAD(P)H-binding protein [Solirubrobacteraceae bacterium]|nr:NAD(P)H-binding protein [Solirubrobacteraceae bacterium]
MNIYSVIGGTGTVGCLIVDELRAAGEQVRVLSRHSPEYPVDLTTGAGLEAALAGCTVVIDASNGSPRAPEAVLVDGARRLRETAERCGVGRIVCVSIVGIDEVPARYYRAKVAQERVLSEGDVPLSVVRSTQFHELVAGAFAALARFAISPRSRARLQPVAAADAARAVAATAREAAPAAMSSVAGPRAATVSELAREWTQVTGRRLAPLALPLPPRLGRPLRAGALTPASPDVRGTTEFGSWLRASR